MTAYEKSKMREQVRREELRQQTFDAVLCFGAFAAIIALFFVLAL